MAPLHYVGTTGDFVNCTCVLVESGADPNIVDIEGKTPLHCAVLNERPGIVKYLCEHDSDVNTMFLLKDWVTPLDCAMLKGNAGIIKLLKQFGGLQAQDIKEHAAVLIQNWFRRKMKIWHSKLNRKLLDSPLHEDASCSNLYTDEDCISVSELLPSFQNSVNNSDIYHMCNGCFHKIVCKHVCNKIPLQNSTEDRAATVLQRAWKGYSLKKQFSRMRNEVASVYTSNDERLSDEELWKGKLKNFLESLNN